MPSILRMLMQRGYWNKADDGGGGGGGGTPNADDEAARKAAEAETARKAEEAKKRAAAGQATDAEAKLQQEVMEKKNALKAANEELAKIRDQLKAFDGIDPVKVRELLKAQADAETAQLEAKGEFEKVKAQMVAAHQAELTKAGEQVATLSAQNASLQSTIAELTVGNAFGASKFILEEMALTPAKARIVFGSHFEFKNGELVGYDKPSGSAKRSVLVDAKGDPLAFEEAIRKVVEMDPDRDQLLKAKMKPGAGSHSTSVRSSGAPRVERELTAREKIAKGLAERSRAK